MKIIPWKTSALILSWVLLAIFLTLLNKTTVDMAWGAIVLATAGYLISTGLLFNPFKLTHKTNENKTDP